ncbi:c-type cytochrome [Limobrevibacterium gyesilva]|uniref:C-type cytochrome n=1 Tax=Limobrevibacterium gyesilva TaxID=2991712 RepID=A0AA41YIF4_9PROT|nr:c-type cytochrome [Limobrevibacterium gyesilva]MCW3474164.1 c-type cytochrome [Limobrevibacterium gyesilva]
MVLRALLLLLLLAGPAAAQDAAGHGGPIRAVAATGDVAISAGFDGSAIVWRRADGKALSVLRFHDGAVNALAVIPGGGFATGGADGRIALWHGGDAPMRVLTGHDGPVAALAASGERIASAAWDGTARVWAADGTVRVLGGHVGNVNGVAFAPGGAVVTAGYDATLRIWPPAGAARVVQLPAPQNAVVVAPDGGIVAGGADGMLRFVNREGGIDAELEIDTVPLTALALSPDGAHLAVASLGGTAVVIERTRRRIVTVLHAAERPLWAVAFAPDGTELLTGGAAGVLRSWDIASGRPTRAFGSPGLTGVQPAQDRGAQIFRACAICHALSPDGGNRAGPTLHGVFGRQAGSVPGYPYSDALRHSGIVWGADTIARLFELGPQSYTPGTKMPEQVIASPEDRRALLDFLRDAAR